MVCEIHLNEIITFKKAKKSLENIKVKGERI